MTPADDRHHSGDQAWEAELALGFEALDHDHRRQARAVAALEGAVRRGGDPQAIESFLLGLIETTHEHFEHEHHASSYSRYLIPGLGNIVAANRIRSRYDKSFCTIMYYIYLTELSGDSGFMSYQADDKGSSYSFFLLDVAPNSYVFSDYTSGAKIWFNPTFQLRRWYHITHQLSSTHNRIIVNYLENPKAYVASKWLLRSPKTVSETPIEIEGILSVSTGFFIRLSDVYIYDYA